MSRTSPVPVLCTYVSRLNKVYQSINTTTGLIIMCVKGSLSTELATETMIFHS